MKQTTNPCAKINLGLHVVERRPDGYHNIETIFYPIPLYDRLTIMEDDEDMLQLSGIPVAGNPSDNLVVRAVNQLRRDFDIPPLFISLEKNIPSGAGLGGGSSDAAYTITLLNEMFQLGMDDAEMERRASLLGADCAFFIKGKPTIAQGIGNEFTPIQLSLKGWQLVLVKPDEFVSTREAYSSVHPKKPARALADVIQQPIDNWEGILLNDFEKSVFPLHPVISEIKTNLQRLGASYVSMSGSGSSVFALFKQIPSEIEEIFLPHFVFTAVL